MNKILLIIPAYNEQENILNTYLKIKEFSKGFEMCLDVLVINDGSTDHTEKILTDGEIPHIKLIHNLGIGGAVQTGYKYAYENDYDIAVQFDGDGQHNIYCLENLISPLFQGYDFSIGSRFVKGSNSEFKSSKARRIGIKMISTLVRFVSGEKVYDVTSGYRAANKKVIKEFASAYPVEYPEPITTTELLRKGYKVREVPVEMYEREGGKSSIHTWKNAYYMVNVLLNILIIKIRRYDHAG
ncbi:glycosyltransferase [Clostridiaceae bacterium DONG20-135]|uniref:Glycosyltransferase n=1 Tax=Copranaerobaculum intestinale TaxID=2692629 RepID=A0A6N8U547_9FIRM|nr:glycosyltransferase family 2 protein [Copranaerobaculum intestinale]MXQ72991.1 glycosyltransferase [Copranaerobaculum intestinale]